ncbi:MAG: 30S ribosomal protein S15 [Lentisphaeria bacterium]|nr:30S ribosomal protein S15 [Lentisphaeria bacterium]
MNKEQKTEIIKKFARSENDVGSPEVQIGVLTARVLEVTEHLKLNKKDHASRRGLIAMVNRRRSLLRYLERKSHERYVTIIKELGLRR